MQVYVAQELVQFPVPLCKENLGGGKNNWNFASL
jgi:hypothetical protein